MNAPLSRGGGCVDERGKWKKSTLFSWMSVNEGDRFRTYGRNRSPDDVTNYLSVLRCSHGYPSVPVARRDHVVSPGFRFYRFFLSTRREPRSKSKSKKRKKKKSRRSRPVRGVRSVRRNYRTVGLWCCFVLRHCRYRRMEDHSTPLTFTMGKTRRAAPWYRPEFMHSCRLTARGAAKSYLWKYYGEKHLIGISSKGRIYLPLGSTLGTCNLWYPVSWVRYPFQYEPTQSGAGPVLPCTSITVKCVRAAREAEVCTRVKGSPRARALIRQSKSREVMILIPARTLDLGSRMASGRHLLIKE